MWMSILWQICGTREANRLLNILLDYTCHSFFMRWTDLSIRASWTPSRSLDARMRQDLSELVKEVLRITPKWQEEQDWGGNPTLYKSGSQTALLFQLQRGSFSGNTGCDCSSQLLVPEAIKKSNQLTQLFLGLKEENHLSAHFHLRLPQRTVPCAITRSPPCLRKNVPTNPSHLWENCSQDLSHILWHSPLSKQEATFSLLTCEISSDHVGYDSPWPDPLSPGCGCPAHSGRGLCIHPWLIFIFLLLQSPHECCVLPAVCKTEWQYHLNPL